MPARVAIITPAPLTRAFGDSLRPLMQARGLWEIGWRDFVVYSAQPDPSLPFEQDKIRTRGRLQLVGDFKHGCDIAHAHQNAGLFLKGRVWPDFHGYAPLESALAFKAQPGLRRLFHTSFSGWATRRLVWRAERVVCASESIMRHLVGDSHPVASVSVIMNTIDPDEYPESTGNDKRVLVIGSFTNRWGRTSFPIALQTARLVPELKFRLIGGVDNNQIAAAAGVANVEITNHLTMEGYRQALREAAIALIPFADWCRGGGARQKIIQAAASGIAVVATPSALEGIEEQSGFLVADSPESLADCLRQLHSTDKLREEAAAVLRSRFLVEYDFRTEAQNLAELYESTLNE